MASHELYTKMEVQWNEFTDNHLKFTDKGNKAAATRARKAIGELKKLVTEYRKESVTESKRSQANMARLTNEQLHDELISIKSDVREIKVRLLDPDDGTISRVNRNTDFRKKANGAIWSVWVVMIGVLAKLIFWD